MLCSLTGAVSLHVSSCKYTSWLERKHRRQQESLLCRPIFVDSTFGAGNASDTAVSADLQDAFETLFFEHGVDMTWHGHHHSYQRSCALYNGTCYPPNTGAAHLCADSSTHSSCKIYCAIVRHTFGGQKILTAEKLGLTRFLSILQLSYTMNKTSQDITIRLSSSGLSEGLGLQTAVRGHPFIW